MCKIYYCSVIYLKKELQLQFKTTRKMKEIFLMLIMFWNCENFFDTFNDPLTKDDDYTPQGAKFWSWKKFTKKRDDIAKTILLVKDQHGLYPALIGLCEIENSFVLQQLTEQTPLARIGYKYIHYTSPDKRGIDVALLYNPKIFNALESKKITVREFLTRDILYVKGVVNALDTLHCFVNHWPSKLGGEERSLPKRMAVSSILKHNTDSILKVNPQANILLMGDFNDTPNSKSLKNYNNFVNMSKFLEKNKLIKGTHKYRQKWDIIDQFLLSNQLFLSQNPAQHNFKNSNRITQNSYNPKWIFCKKNSIKTFTHKSLLLPDKIYLGFKLNKTLLGPRYLGGVSDHLPILLKVYANIME